MEDKKRRKDREGESNEYGRGASHDGRVFLRPMIVRDPYKYVNGVYYSNARVGVRHSKIAAQTGKRR